MQHTQSPHRFAGAVVALMLLLASTCHAQGGKPPENKHDFSDAEKLLFMSKQLTVVKPASTIRYSFRKTGSFEEGFEDSVVLTFDPQPDGSCCIVKSDFFTGARRLPLPDAPMAEGNPVLLHFLERDIAEMKRLTQGSLNHFRKRIRMAVYQEATVRDASFAYQGRTIAGKEVTFSPYLDDPNRPKYEKFARKQYQFLLSEAVPGGIYGIRTRIGNEIPDAPAVIAEDLFVEGASPASPSQSQ
ncbi:MAG: hypothetical protein K2X42_04255 [Burkholderiaceae bacterium]|nr:hypothetical protein [Burkholderiaceae bacterium]